jgi:hypothetical protein
MLQIIEGKMKSLLEFKSIVEEEKQDYSKFDALVRAGLANKAQLQRIHKILDKMGEERPVFNNADREIMRNLFNRMVDLVSSKQIYGKARQAVREDLNEGMIDTADFKVDIEGKKHRRSRLKVGDVGYEVQKESRMDSPLVPDPPVILVIKRKAVRLYPDGTRIAMYWSDKLKRVFSVPYGTSMDAPIQAEEYIKELVEAEEILLNDGNILSLSEETKQQIINTYSQLEEDSKEYFWQQLTESVTTFGKINEFCRLNSAK